MRALSLVIAAALTLSGAAASAQTGALPLSQGEATTVTLGGPVRDVVVADPNVADVSIINERSLVVMGKRPGATTVMVFGANGRALTTRQVVVSEIGDAGVTAYRGATSTNYLCAGHCSRVGPAAAAGTP